MAKVKVIQSESANADHTVKLDSLLYVCVHVCMYVCLLAGVCLVPDTEQT